MTLLLGTLEKEIELLADAGSSKLTQLLSRTDQVLQSLRNLEADLVADLQAENGEQSYSEPSRSASEKSTPGLKPSNEFNGSYLILIESALSTTLLLDQKLSSCHSGNLDSLRNETSNWYAGSIGDLKGYNSQILKFLKNVVNNTKFRVDLDEAYTFPLELNSAPAREISESFVAAGLYDVPQLRRSQNRAHLMKSIAVHFLKMGHETCLEDILKASGLEGQAQMQLVDQFHKLGLIVEDIKVRHELTRALDWLEKNPKLECHELLFRLHSLQYALILSGNGHIVSNGDGSNSDNHFKALLYSKAYISKFYGEYSQHIEKLMTLLILKLRDTTHNDDIIKECMYKAFVQDFRENLEQASQKKHMAEIIRCYPNIHENQTLFDTLANKLMSEFCASMGLSNDSSLFEALLSGFVNLPNFYKYNRLQLKLGAKKTEEIDSDELDLPFQLPDKNRFLFNYHPIFICPVSKEQLMPLTTEEESHMILLVAPDSNEEKNPVVVFDLCRHLALKESVRSLLRGSDRFKCHYCYKKHKILEVKDAFFIDL